MGRKTIEISDDVHRRPAAERLGDESFSEPITRLLDSATAAWTRGFGRYGDANGEDLERLIRQVQADHAAGSAHHHREVLETLGFDLDATGNIRTKPDDPK